MTTKTGRMLILWITLSVAVAAVSYAAEPRQLSQNGKIGDSRIFKDSDTLLLLSAIIGARRDFWCFLNSPLHRQRRILTSISMQLDDEKSGQREVRFILFAKDAKKRVGYRFTISGKVASPLDKNVVWKSSETEVFRGDQNFRDDLKITVGALPEGAKSAAVAQLFPEAVTRWRFFDADTLDMVTSAWIGYADLLAFTSAGQDRVSQVEVKLTPAPKYYFHQSETTFHIQDGQAASKVVVRKCRSLLEGPEAPFVSEILH